METSPNHLLNRFLACEQAPSEPARSEKNSASEELDSASLTESHSSLAEFFFQTLLGACSQANRFRVMFSRKTLLLNIT